MELHKSQTVLILPVVRLASSPVKPVDGCVPVRPDPLAVVMVGVVISICLCCQPELVELSNLGLLPNLQQLLSPFLIGGKATDFTNKIPHMLGVLRQTSLRLIRTWFEVILGCLMTLVHTHHQFIPWRHFSSLVEVNQAILAW